MFPFYTISNANAVWLKLTANDIITKKCTNVYHNVKYQLYKVKYK